jgi:Mannosyl-glycoprotein endo-beta-N-acetylglucosaminidase
MTMKKFITIAAFSFGIMALATAKDKPKNDYIERFTVTALEEKAAYNVLACISMAQGILESGWGEGRFAQHNNHFGIKCHKDWTGETFNTPDDDYDAEGNLIESCFRAYATPEESWRDHSIFLQKPRYQSLYDYGTDYRKWAHGLQSAHYATDTDYAQKLIGIIERYELYRLDGLTAPIPAPDVFESKEENVPKSMKIKAKEEANDGTLFEITPDAERSFDDVQTEKEAPKAEFIPKDYIRGQGEKVKESINNIWQTIKPTTEKVKAKKKNWFDEGELLEEITPKTNEKTPKTSSLLLKNNNYGEKVVAMKN